MIRGLINTCHHYIAKSHSLVKFFLLVRNQCDSIIGYYVGSTSDFFNNGESLIVDFIADKCSIALDVGANKGMWSDYFLSKNTSLQIFLFEPSLNAFNLLTSKFNGVPNVELINKGLAEIEKQSVFYEEPGCGETSSVVKGVSNANAKRTEIHLTTVDLITKQYQLPIIDFLKIDVEGYDFFVLKGAVENLKGKQIKFIQFEYNSFWASAGSTLIDAISFLSDYGYKTFLVRNNGLYEFDYSKYGEYYRYSNFFALPEESAAIIEPLIKGTI